MSDEKPTEDTPAPLATPIVEMRLYIADTAPNSAQAIANLESICKEYPNDNFRLEVIDVIRYPLRALADGILVTPSLNKVSPLPAIKIVGNLSDKNSVRLALGISDQMILPPSKSASTIREVN
jgi:circadian clock protein KaiB